VSYTHETVPRPRHAVAAEREPAPGGPRLAESSQATERQSLAAPWPLVTLATYDETRMTFTGAFAPRFLHSLRA
jgi:hypothetical protein